VCLGECGRADGGHLFLMRKEKASMWKFWLGRGVLPLVRGNLAAARRKLELRDGRRTFGRRRKKFGQAVLPTTLKERCRGERVYNLVEYGS